MASGNLILNTRALYKNYNYGATVWSALDSGMLTGKVGIRAL